MAIKWANISLSSHMGFCSYMRQNFIRYLAGLGARRGGRGLGETGGGGKQVRNLLTLCEAHVDAAANGALVCFRLGCVTAHSHLPWLAAAPGSSIHKHALFMKQRMHGAV